MMGARLRACAGERTSGRFIAVCWRASGKWIVSEERSWILVLMVNVSEEFAEMALCTVSRDCTEDCMTMRLRRLRDFGSVEEGGSGEVGRGS
jgi:hypothetical protein